MRRGQALRLHAGDGRLAFLWDGSRGASRNFSTWNIVIVGYDQRSTTRQPTWLHNSAGLWIGLAIVVAVAMGACSGEQADQGPAPPLPTAAPGAHDVVKDADLADAHAGTLRIAAAANLALVIESIVADIEATCEVTVVTVLGSSGQIKEQIAAGADFALFLSADEGFPAELDAAGLVAEGGLAPYAAGPLALVTREGLPAVESVADLADENYDRIAIANPGHAPYGLAAEAALEGAGIADAVDGRLVYGENVRQAVDYVLTGNADAGIVAHALVAREESLRPVLVDPGWYPPVVQSGAVIRGRSAERPGRCALQYLLNPDGQDALRTAGFEGAPPP